MTTNYLYGTYIEKAGDNIPYDMTIEYYLTEQPLCCEKSELTRYGVLVRKLASTDGGEPVCTSQAVNDIFYRKEDAERFIKILIREKVTPATFREITEEFVTDRLDFSGLDYGLARDI